MDLTFRLQRFIHLLDIAEIVLPLERYCPGLYVTKCLVLDITVQRRRFQYRNKVIHEFSRGYLHEKMVSSVLDAYISQLDMENVRNGSKDLELAYAQRQELHVWVLMVQSTF